MKNDFSHLPDFGGFTEGLLAGAKLRALKEEIAYSQLQRAEFENTTGYRESMRQIGLAKEQNDLARGESNLLLDELVRHQREQMFPTELAGAKASLGLTKQQTRGAKADADVAQATKGSRIRQSNSQADISQNAALGAQLNNIQNFGQILQRGSKTFTAGDYQALAKMVGSPDGAASETTAMLLGQEIEGAQAQYRQEKAQLDAAKQQDGYLRLGQTIDFLQRLGPAGAQALKGQGIFPDSILDAISSQDGNLTPEQKSELSGIDKALASTFDQLGTVEGQMAPYRAKEAAGQPIANTWFGKDDATDYAGLKQSLTEVQAKRQFLEDERNRVIGGRKSQVQRGNPIDQNNPRQSIGTVLDNFVFDRNPTDSDIKELIGFLKSKGVVATESEIKTYIKSRSK